MVPSYYSNEMEMDQRYLAIFQRDFFNLIQLPKTSL